MATMRTAKTNSLYVLFRSKTNPDEYVIENTDGIGGSGALKKWGSTVTFTTGDLKMDVTASSWARRTRLMCTMSMTMLFTVGL